ncbi:hypothetical protein PSEUBRA_005971 [Kalmanozyma brasiliensis GHG001]|uniref:GYF domain-containing protein n=1 Tax=Kalmanozyma brasiliensis (strain GHG001) TaxID=1365824 RepID=V5EJ09_KALBG|nr:uncharacterized protein PSEUBRA_005971 [Kalmanozyma brasiliensis GHG001]EST04695.1 hypothetical protein PSEUBRA_005971 [Kalmanozyma brasiliensis GHG001]
MATSMQFGPEWMRKGPTSKSGGKENPASTTPSAATSPGTGPVAGTTAPSNGSNGNSGGKRNGGPVGLANLSGPAPVVSPSVSSPGAFSFAAAAAAATAQSSDRNGTHASTPQGDSDSSSTTLLNGSSAALAKDKVSREKMLSLYSSDRTSKNASAEPSPVEAVPPGGSAAPERSTSTSRRKVGSDRRQPGFADFVAVGAGPLSPGLGSNEPRGLNARSTSGGSSGGFGSAGTSNWDKAEKERPGLFQRASNGALAGVTTNSGSRPLSPSVSRDRFTGIQGGVLSGVAPPARKRMDSNDGGPTPVEAPSRSVRSLKSSQDEVHAPQSSTNGAAGGMGSWGRSSQSAIGQSGTIGNGGGVMGAFSDAFSSNRVRGRNVPAAADVAVSAPAAPPAPAVESSQPTQPIVPSANPEGLSISARFARHKDRLPGEGPIGPPSDGSIGFGKSSGVDRRRERQISQARPMHSQLTRGDASAVNGGSAALHTQVTEQPSTQAQEAVSQIAAQADHGLGSDDQDLAQHASAVLGSLKLDEDDSPGLPPTSALAGDHLGSNTDDLLRGRDVRDHFEQQQQQHHHPQATMQAAPWSPETSMWLYRDMAGNVQGPFSSLMMQDWYSQQYFADDLLIKRQEDVDFKPLAQVVAAVGNALQPFIIPPSNWLHSPAPPRPAFETNSGAEQSRFSDTFDSNRSWAAQAGRQQQPQQSQQQQQGWPSSLTLGGLGNSGPAPASPFGRHDIFSAAQSGLRNQDDVMSMLRERELHEQRQAAGQRGPGGMHLGQLDSFGGGLGRSGWGNESAMTPSHWGGIGHGGLGQFGDVGLGGGHQSPLVGDRQPFDNFGHQQQRQNFDQASSPWTNTASVASRSQFDSMRQAQQGQWGEQQAQAQQQQHQQPQQQQQQAPWTYSATTPDVSNRQMDFSEALLRNEAIKAADPIGTPRRSRSPAPQHDVTSAHQQAVEHKAELHQSFENAFPAPTQQDDAHVHEHSAGSTAAFQENDDKTLAVNTHVDVAQPATPQKKMSKREAQKTAAAAAAASVSAVSAAQAPTTPAKTADTDIPPPEAFTTGEPRPEELWPQSPKAVEFASEPELSGMPAMTLTGNKAAKDVKRESRSALQRQPSDVSRSEPATRAAAAARPTGASNVRVVSQEQFRRGKELESVSAQAPLSDWLNDASTTGESPAPASRPAPWAAAKDDSTSTTGPSLREIQEAEAKRAEAKRAAEKAAARARMAATPGAADDLPTTLSWGLASAPATKTINTEAANAAAAAAAAAAGSPATPVWNAGKTAPKKTLMEIQEEERKRAEKLKAQQNAQAIAMRKGYADSAGRTASSTIAAPTAASGGGAWSVVGAGGKPSTPSGAVPATAAAASPLAARPGVTPASRTASATQPPTSTGSPWNVVGTKPATISTPSALPASPSPATRIRSTADPTAPSPEFIRYCKENLVGLTIKTDDFIDMLLQFPLDPSADVIEIIADTVYANSSTLDGRRFANDFVSKRKLDVQGRTGVKWGATSGGVKTPSVKTVEKVTVGKVPGQGEGFKVVKGKGGKKR